MILKLKFKTYWVIALVFWKICRMNLKSLFIWQDYFRYDGGAQILSYDWCNASYNASYPEHRDLRENLCPTDTYKIVTEDPQDGDVVNWNGTKEILYEQVFAIQYTTVESKLYMDYLLIF